MHVKFAFFVMWNNSQPKEVPPSINGKRETLCLTVSHNPQPRRLSHRKKNRQNKNLLFTSNIKHPEIFLSVAQEGREGEFKKQDHIYLFIEDFFLPGHKYRKSRRGLPLD